MNWRQKAYKLLAETDLSQRAIARHLGVPKSTLNDWVRLQGSKLPEVKSSGPKVLVFDIETAPVLGYVWSLWKQNVGLNQIKEDWYVLSYAAKWYGEEHVYYEDQRNAENIEDDRDILQGIWNLLDEADIVITHNGKRFDSKKLNARFILNGMKPPRSYRHIDTLEIVKKHFAFTSNRLAYLTDKLCTDTVKSSHGKFSGFTLWSGCLEGDLEAWKTMEEYNIDDVKSLEELYNILAPWSNSLPNFDTYHKDLTNADLSGTMDLIPSGYVYTNLGKYQRYVCKKTGRELRGRVNLLSKDKRSSLKSNVIS